MGRQVNPESKRQKAINASMERRRFKAKEGDKLLCKVCGEIYEFKHNNNTKAICTKCRQRKYRERKVPPPGNEPEPF